MKLIDQGNNIYEISTEEGKYTIRFYLSSQKLKILVKTEKTEENFERVLTLGAFIDADHRLKGFDSVEEIYTEIRAILKRGSFEVKKINDEIYFFLKFFEVGTYIRIFNEKQSESETISLKKEIEELKSENARLKEKIKNLENLDNKQTEFYQTVLTAFKEISDNQIGKIDQLLKRKVELDEPPKEKEEEKRTVSYSVLTKFKLQKEIKDHSSYVLNVCITKDGRLASCSEDKTIKIFNLQTFECEITINEQCKNGFHKGRINYISALEDGNLVSCSYDKTIKIWSLEKNSYSCVATLTGHNNAILKVIGISKDRIASCSWDETVKIWNSKPPYKCIETLKGHVHWVYSVIELKKKNFIVSGSLDYTLRFWNSTTYNCEKIIENIYCNWMNNILEVSTGKIIVGSQNEVTVIDLDNFEVEGKIEIEEDVGKIYSLLELGKGTVIGGTSDGKFVELNIIQYNVLGFSDAHKKPVHGLIKDEKDNSIVSCSEDNLIKIWKY